MSCCRTINISDKEKFTPIRRAAGSIDCSLQSDLPHLVQVKIPLHILELFFIACAGVTLAFLSY